MNVPIVETIETKYFGALKSTLTTSAIVMLEFWDFINSSKTSHDLWLDWANDPLRVLETSSPSTKYDIRLANLESARY